VNAWTRTYIEALPAWQQDVCGEVRHLVHAADPDVAETITFRNRPVLRAGGNYVPCASGSSLLLRQWSPTTT
jgi:hypothetical protein